MRLPGIFEVLSYYKRVAHQQSRLCFPHDMESTCRDLEPQDALVLLRL